MKLWQDNIRRAGFLLRESEVQMAHDRKHAFEHTDNEVPVIRVYLLDESL
jgi:hypothetical protein